jgi:hypothetical protein
MAKHGRHRRTPIGPFPVERSSRSLGGRSPRGWTPFTAPAAPTWSPLEPGDREPDLVVDVRRMLRASRPLDLLLTVSAMLSLVDPRGCDRGDGLPARRSRHAGHDELDVETVLESFVEVDVPESTALLAALAVLAPDAPVRERAAAEVTRRGHELPPWIAGFADARLRRAVVLSHERSDSDNLMVGVGLPPALEWTMSIHVDHALGSVVADGLAVAAPLAVVLDRLRGALDDPETSLDALPLDEARTRISRAVEAGARLVPPVETDDWPRCRPLVEWLVRLPG